MNKNALKGNLTLLFAAIIWGLAFVAQSDAMNHIGPFAFTSMRCALGAFVLVPVCIINLKSDKKVKNPAEMSQMIRTTVKIGCLCGVIVFFAIITQQIGLMYTAAGKAGFITALYIVLVPVVSVIFFNQKSSVKIWLGGAFATVGLYLLCIKEGFTIGTGDLWVIACAVVFTFHIIIIDRFADKVNGVLLSAIQFAIVSLISLPLALIFEDKLSLSDLSSSWITICYTGILSCGVGYTMQIIGQKHSKNPTIASLLMSMESVFAAIFGWLILKEQLSLKEILGVLLMSAAIVLSQLPSKAKSKEAAKVSE